MARHLAVTKSGVCGQIHRKGYICTLDPGHEGKHKAEDLNDDVICEW